MATVKGHNEHGIRGLAQARKTRSQMRQLFARIERDELSVSELLMRRPRCLERISVYDVLRRLPHLDRTGAERVLKKSKVWPLTKWRDLTIEDREKILLWLPPRVKR